MFSLRRTSCGRSVRTYDCIRRRPRPQHMSPLWPACAGLAFLILLLCAPLWCVYLLCGALLAIFCHMLLWRR